MKRIENTNMKGRRETCRGKRKLRNRVISVAISAVIVSNSIPFAEMPKLPSFAGFPSISDFLPKWGGKDSLVIAAADYVNKWDGTTDISITDINDLVAYSYFYQTDSDFADYHEEDTISIALSGSNVLSADYLGIGTSAHPFQGQLKLGSSGSYSLSAHRALFAYLSDKATISDGDGNPVILSMTRLSGVSDGVSAPVLADHVQHFQTETEEVTDPADWRIQINVESGSSATFSGAIGEIGSNALVNLSFNNSAGTNVISNAAVDTDSGSVPDVGMFCGTLGDSAELTVNYTGSISCTIASTYGNAGSFVGTMSDNSSLTVVSALTSVTSSIEAKGDETDQKGYAGGLVGMANSTALIHLKTAADASDSLLNTLSITGTVTGTTGAGGLYGNYKVEDVAGDNDVPEIDLNDYTVTATTYGKYCGGLFGVLESTGDLSITNSGTEKQYSSQSGDESVADYAFGGVAGKFTTSALTNTTTLTSLEISPTSEAAFNAFGGVFGLVDSAAYIKTTDTVYVSANKTNNGAHFGGLVGSTSDDSGVFIDLGNFTLVTNSTQFTGGGIVGQFNNGVLRLSGTTDMTDAKPADAADCGQLVGVNKNVLVYTPGSWTFNRADSATTDDLGTWGEVVRISGIEPNIVTYDPNGTAHTVTVAAAQTTMNTPTDFVKTALNIQLNQGQDYDCLKFTSGSGTHTSLLNGTLTIGADISLVNAGITGFMRDGGTTDEIGAFTGTLSGGSHAITLATGESYGTGVSGQTEGMGQIYRHPYNGLFSVLSGTVSNLTIDGTINVNNRIDGMNIGGIAACSGSAVNLTSVTAKETVNYRETSKVTGTPDAGKNIGGFIGFVGENGTITINGISSIEATFNLSGSHESWNVYGGAIGKITASAFTVTIGTENDSSNNLTNKLNTTITGVTTSGANGDCGGLIGYITSAGSYSGRKVNINNLEFNNCTVSNAATSTGGGFLGYSWLDTTANIKGLTITSGTITNSSASNIGVLCYSATGKWDVDALTITSMTMSTGGSKSVGMLVNKAYDGDNGLYLDLYNAGYTLSSAPAVTSEVFDEICAYSASDVLSGGKGAGVISIDMNTGGTTKTRVVDTGTTTVVTGTGTYTKKLSSKTDINPNTRYYYNLQHLGTTDRGENLLLYSVKNYAATNIQNEFVPSTGSPFTGTADMTGLSFYPIPLADASNIGAFTLTFDYKGIYDSNTARDPGVANQHYLMQSGLFLNSTAGTTLTVSGALSLNGNFLEVGKYSGVLISDTMQGNLTCTSGSISLNGIVAKTTGGIDYSDGYLLINKIYRKDDVVAVPKLKLYNVSTGTGYTAGATVAKSLIGPASGPGLEIEFSKVKLDGRSTADATDAMTTAYHTTKSIFSQATLLDSIKTDLNAQLTYNYTFDDDWGTPGGRNVTYGYEVSGSKEYENKETKYSSVTGDDKKRYSTHPDSAPTASSGPYSFANYKRYVYNNNTDYTGEKYGNGLYYRELRVNVETDGLIEGCGTYNDPYIITDAAQLNGLAEFLRDGTQPKLLGDVNLPNTKPTIMESGNRWCEGKNSHAVYSAGDSAFAKPTDSAAEWANTDVQRYLASAYYKVERNITLGSTFKGLGGTTANTAFRGVIVGTVSSTGVPIYTITNQSDNPLIMVSNGCVVKDINIAVEKADGITKTQGSNAYNKAYFSYAHDTGNVCKFYGGIIGEIMGGDNIIDNSYVSYQYTTEEPVLDDNNEPVLVEGVAQKQTVTKTTQITLAGTSGTIVPVGGYVGVVVFGGLIFKNMDARKTTLASTHLNVVYGENTYNLADNSGQEAWAAIYVNPIVGRVINGYAVNETGGNALDAEGNSVQQFSVTENGTYHDTANSGAGTARTGNQHTIKNGKKHYSIADIDPSLAKLDVTKVPTSTSDDGNINVPNAQAMFVLSLITQSTAGTAQTANGNYVGSLSYGTNGTGTDSVYGMSRVASYSDIGTVTTGFDQVSDYYNFAWYDTAALTSIPYVIKRYTTGNDDIKSTIWTETTINHYSSAGTVYSGDATDLDGQVFFLSISNTDSKKNQHTHYLTNTIYSAGSYSGNIQRTDEIDDAAAWLFESASNGKYYLSTIIDYEKKYLCRGKNAYSFTTDQESATAFEVAKNSTNFAGQAYYVAVDGSGINAKNGFGDNGNVERGFGWYDTDNVNSRVTLTNTVNNPETKYIPITSVTAGTGYPARCVTSTLGYYNINLTGSGTYQLPDSFRGLGSVGYYDNTSVATMQNTDYASRQNNKYCMKVDTFSGNNLTIDEDIYLNRYVTDNYFSRLHNSSNATQAVQSNTDGFDINTNTKFHGIGLFDSIVMKDANSKLDYFKLSGSINTAIFSNTYAASAQEQTGANNNYKWHAVSGVVGSSINGSRVNFSRIALDHFSVRGSSYIGGLLGHSGNKSTDIYINIDRCSATGLKLNLAATDNYEKYRDALGGFVGKVKEGGVKIYGTADGDHNTSDAYSTVELSSVLCVNSDRAGAGGLVGYAGNGCEAYDMHVDAADGCEVTIGGTSVSMVGGIVGSMQPAESKYESCKAIFSNCEINEINLSAGEYAGGIYGGAHNNDWSPYSIKVTNCRVTGNSTSNNTITAKNYAGGLIGDAYIVSVAAEGHANVEIADTIVSNYTISTSGNNTAAGGFIGYADAYVGLEKNGDLEEYANNSVICYIHNSSVEKCRIAVNGQYGGGVVGKIIKHSGNKVLGYNIKLNNVTSTSSGMGAWLGFVDTTDDSTSIRFTGLGIYGNDFAKNVGNRSNFTNAAFVFADYNGQCNAKTVDDTDTISVSELNRGSTVDMPRYPFVNLFPQSKLGTNEVLSGDAAVLNRALTANEKTAAGTMAAKIYAEKDTAGTAQQYYSTFNDDNINGTNKISYYMNRTTNDDGDRISTFATEQKITLPNGVDDFAVVVIASSNNTETTDLINRYIQLVTNTPNSGATANYADTSDGYHRIEIKKCQLDPETGSFTIVKETDPETDEETDAPAGIMPIDSDKQFKLDIDHADSLDSNTFTLVDVQFLDPLGKQDIAYHLYVPVYTFREMPVNFYASARSGNHSVDHTGTNEYAALMSSNLNYADTLNAWMTQYIRYEYQAIDINALLNSGNLQWGYNKTIKFQTYTTGDDDARIPDNTYLTLVNPNGNSDQIYYAKAEDMAVYPITGNNRTKECLTVSLANFKKSDEVTAFAAPSFNKMIAKDIQETLNTGKGKYDKVRFEDIEEDDIIVYRMDRDGNNIYYKLNTNNTGAYDLSVPSDYTLCEDYYISMYVPANSNLNALYHYTIEVENRLESNDISFDTDEAPNVRSAGVNKLNTCTILIADLFEQIVKEEVNGDYISYMTVSKDDEQIKASNKAITVDISVEVIPRNNISIMYLDNTNDLFHSFYITLVRHSKDAVENDIKGLSASNITAKYSIDAPVTSTSDNCSNVDLNLISNYLNVATTSRSDSSSLISKLKSDNHSFKIYSQIVMDFDEEELAEEFPERDSSIRYGVNVEASSNLAYDNTTLAYTSMTEKYLTDDHYYYIESVPSAILRYSSKKEDSEIYDEIGANSKNQSTLGVNGRSAVEAERSSMPVNSEAFYNVQSLSDADDANTLRLTFAIKKKSLKNGKFEYVPITDMQNYIEGTITFTSGSASATATAIGSLITVDLDATQCDRSGDIYDINISFNAKSGGEFTQYSNYEVDLTAELYDIQKDGNTVVSEENIGNSVASDYLIYTNAKINPNIIKALQDATVATP